MLRIHSLDIQADSSGTRFSCAYQSPEKSGELWFQTDLVDERLTSHKSYSGFLLALLLLGMKHGNDIQVEGPVSPLLLDNLRHFGIPLIRSLFPWMHEVRVTAESGPAARPDGTRRVAIGFSGGIDAFAALYDHYYREDVPAHLKISQLLFNNVGSHGQNDRDEPVFKARFAALQPVAREIGLPFNYVNSNLDPVLGLNFLLTHPIRNVAVAVLLEAVLERFYYSSGVDYRNAMLSNADEMGRADPALLPMFSTENIQVVSTGFQHSRSDKTRLVARIPAACKHLQVCLSTEDPDHNCSQCYKCLRTMLTLHILGCLDAFRECFDLPYFHANRARYERKVMLNTRDIFHADIIRLARETGYPLPGYMIPVRHARYIVYGIRNRILRLLGKRSA